jgi:adenylate cyclase
MPALLKIIHKNKNEEEVICTNVMTIGRDKSSTVCLQDPLASRNHGIIRAVGREQYYLLDSGSRNGIFHNTRRISAPILLTNGDKVTIGDSVMHFSQDVEVEEDALDNTTDFAETMHYIKADIRSVVILVSDIRGFTAMSESLPIETLTKLMSNWFEAVQSAVENNFGIVDKFIGDCVLAKWEVDAGDTESLFQALQTALEIEAITSKLHLTYPELGKPLKIGVGLNQGEAAVGIGVDNTIMGDVVNTAFRLETASKDLNTDVVLNSNFYKILPDNFPLNEEKIISVKGKSVKLQVSPLSFTDIAEYMTNRPSTTT